MLFHMKDQKAAVLENDLNKLQKDGPAVWASLPEDELFTPAGFSEEQAEATAYSNYSYWGSTFRAFFKNKMAVALLIALVAVVAFAFAQPHLPGQVDPNLCEVDPATGVQYRNIAPGEMGFIWGSNAIGQDLWARIWAGARTSLIIAFYAMWLRRYMVDESNKDYVRLARAKGVSENKIALKHIFRNAMVPLVQYIPSAFLNTVVGSIYIESLYSIPGMGGLLVTCVQRHDNTLVQGIVLLYACVGIIGLILGDLLMVLIDPRISLGKKEGGR